MAWGMRFGIFGNDEAVDTRLMEGEEGRLSRDVLVPWVLVMGTWRSFGDGEV
jgi:hypothetical protein